MSERFLRQAVTTMLDYDFGLGEWIVRPQRCCVERGSEVVRLAPKAMAVLTRLAASPGEVVTRQQLFDSVWPRVEVSDDALTQRVAELRRAFDDSPQDPHFIETIPKVGFRLVCPITEILAESAAGSDTANQPAATGPTQRESYTRERPKPEDRLRSSLSGIGSDLEVASPEAGRMRGRGGKHRRLSPVTSLGLALIAVVLATLTIQVVLNNRPDGGSARHGTSDVTRFSIPLRDEHDLHYGDCYNMREPAFQGRYPTSAVDFSNDGQMLIFAARDLESDTQRLYLRRLDTGEIRPMPGTEGGYGPSFSPDDRWIGFFDGRYLKRAPVAGGEAEIIVEAPFQACDYGAGIQLAASAWVDAATLYLSAGRSLVRVDTSGSVDSNLAEAGDRDGYLSYRGLHVLPGGKVVLVHRYPRNQDPVRAAIFALDPDSGESKLLVSDAMHPLYLARTGHLLFMRRGTLMAVAFDPVSPGLSGEPFVVQPGIMQAVGMHNYTVETGEAQLALSQAGHLAYVPGGVWPGVPRPLLRVSLDGAVESLHYLGEREWGQVRVSPSGNRLLFGTLNGRGATVYVHDIARNVTQKLDTGGFFDHWYAWSPDESAIAFSSDQQGGTMNAFTLRLDGERAPERVAPSMHAQTVADWAVDGSIVYLQQGDIWRLPPGGEAHALFTSEAIEMYPDVSPDGAWLAYAAGGREGGRQVWGVYVRPFPGPGVATLVANSSAAPVWSRDGKRLYYLTAPPETAELMVVDVEGGTPSPARRLMDWPANVFIPMNAFDVLPDGSFIAPPKRAHEEPYRAGQIEVVLNFATQLERRMGLARGGDL